MKRIGCFLLGVLMMSMIGCTPTEQNPPPSQEPTFSSVYARQAYRQLTAIEKAFRSDKGVISETSAKLRRANLWTYGAYFTAVAKLVKAEQNDGTVALMNGALRELEWYACSGMDAYASDNGRERPVFFDDNAWLVYGLLEMYQAVGRKELLDRAIAVQNFIYTGWQEELGGGLLWRQFDPASTSDKDYVRNTCINAPTAMNAATIYRITNDATHLTWAEKIFDWTQKTLKNTQLGTYYDCINRAGEIDKAQFTYNSGCMLSAAALLYDITKEEKYAVEAASIAEGSLALFSHKHVSPSVQGDFYNDSAWFRVYLFQGFADAARYCGESCGAAIDGCIAGYDYAVKRGYYDSLELVYDRWDGTMKPEAGETYVAPCREACGNAQSIAVFAEYKTLKRG